MADNVTEDKVGEAYKIYALWCQHVRQIPTGYDCFSAGYAVGFEVGRMNPLTTSKEKEGRRPQ